MRSGGLTPGGARYGGSRPRVQIILEALNGARGTAYDVTETSPVWVENLAHARAIADVWDTNELLGNQFDPARMSVLLSRWEKIYGLQPAPTDSDATRRARVAAHVSRTGVAPTRQEIADRIAAALSPVTCTADYSSPGGTGVVTSWPGDWYVQSTGTTPPTVTLTGTPAGNYDFCIDIRVGGARGTATFSYSTDNGITWTTAELTAASVTLGSTGLTAAFSVGTYNVDNLYFATPLLAGWYTTALYIAFVCTKPSWMSEVAYYALVSKAQAFLDAMMPAWVTWTFVRDGVGGAHFYTDDLTTNGSPNLDNERLA